MELQAGDMQNMNFKKMIYFIILITCLIIYFYNSDIIISAVKEAIMICYNTVIPSLYIFMIISSLLSTSVFADILGVIFSPLFRILNITDKKITAYCVLSILGGFAAGGYFLNKISHEYECDKNLRYLLTLITSNNSPAFIITAIGSQMLGNTKNGIMIYTSVIVSCYITVFLLSFILPYDNVKIKSDYFYKSSITDAVKTSVNSMLNICGVIISAFTVCKVIQLYIRNCVLSAFIPLFFEVTTACNHIAEHFNSNIYITCTAVSIFPLSAYFQMKSFDDKNCYSFKILFLSKLFQIPLCLSVLRILINVFPQIDNVYANGDIKVNIYWNSPQISICLLIISVIFVICCDDKIGVFTKLNK